MEATQREVQAAEALGRALLEYAIAREEARNGREQAGQRRAIREPVEGSRREDESERPADLLVDAKAAARMLSIGERSLWTLTAPRGPIPSIHLGRAVRYSVASLEDFVRRSEAHRR